MKTLLPIAPSPAPSAPAGSAPQREPEDVAESFASVLDRCHPASQRRGASGETSGEESEPVAAEPSEVISESVDVESKENPTPQPLGLPPPVFPMASYQSIVAPSVGWSPVASDDAAPVDGTDEGTTATVDAGPFTARASAQSAAPISAAPRPGVTVLAAPDSEVTAALPVEGTESLTIRGAGPAAQFLPPTPATEAHHVGIAMAAEQTAPVPAMTNAAPDVIPSREAGAAASVDEARSGETPTLRFEVREPAPQPPDLGRAQTEQPAVASSPIVAHSSALKDHAATPAENTAMLDGTPAAKRGEVMPSVAIPTPVKPRVARSAPDSPTAAEPMETRPANTVVETTATPEIRDILRKLAAEDTKPPLADQRATPEAGPSPDAPSAPHVDSQTAAVSRRIIASEPAPAVEAGIPRDAEAPTAAIPELRVELGTPTHFPTASPDTERVKSEAVATDTAISRAEMVRIVERTAEAAVRIRATGSERIEVAVQLESGDRLTIQLQFANGEVTPHFRTNSDGLRTALEQHWSQFTERASDRGVRLTPPVFDANSSSSNMTDLSQQRHGRDTAYAEAQAELFPHLPRRMRPPRVLATAPSETAASAGVRAYA